MKFPKISAELFIILFGIWSIASNLAVVFKLPFSALGYLFPVLLTSGILLLYKYGFFANWKTKIDTEKDKSSVKTPTRRITEYAFVLLVIIMILVALFANKYNFDDAHYIRTAVDMVDHPEKPLLLDDALGFFDGAPLLIPVYKAHSIESFCAAISSLTGIPVIYVFHFLLPVIGLFLSVMAYFLLFRELIPQKALLATIISFVLIYPVSLRAMGNITFIRMHQGKGVLLGVILPLIITYGLKATRENKIRDWILLGFTQICAIGMNATALWLAPLVANLAVIAGSIAYKPSLLIRNIAYGLLSSLYIFLFGLFLITNFQMPPFYITQDTKPFKLIADSVERVFGNGVAMYMSFFIIFFSWLFAPNRQSRILCVVYPVVLLIVFYNPLLVKFLAEHIVSEQTYWRTAWLIPLQMFIGIIGVSPFLKNKTSWLLYPKLIFIVGMFMVFLLYSPTRCRLLAKKSRVDIKYPSLRVTNEYYIAKQINKIMVEEDVLVSPNIISMWISTMHHHPETLVYRVKFTLGVLYYYLNVLNKGRQEDMDKFIKWTKWYTPTQYSYPSKTKLARDIRKLRNKSGVEALQVLLDYEFKLVIKEYISGETSLSNPQEYLSKGIEHFKITAVCLPVELKWRNEVIETLDKIGFKKIDTIDEFELWKKT